MLQPVLDRLAHVERRRQDRDPAADVGQDLAARTVARCDLHADLVGVHAFRVLVELGPAGAAADVAHLRHLHDQPLGHGAEARALVEADAGPEGHAQQHRALVEVRQEGARQIGGGDASRQHGSPRDAEQRPHLAERPAQHALVPALQQAHERALAVREPLHARQQQQAQHGRDGDGGHERGQDGDDVGDAQRGEQLALDAGQGEQRQEHQDDDGGGVDDAGAHLLAGRRHHLQRRARLARLAVLLEPAEHVLHVHHGVVDQFADGDGEAAERHGVDAQPEGAEHQHGDEQRHRDGRDRDRRRPHVEQEGEQHDRHDDDGLFQHRLQVGDRELDEPGLAEQDAVRAHPLRQRPRRLGHHALDLGRDLDRIGAGLLLDGDDDGRLALDATVAAAEARAELDPCHLAEQDRRPARARGDHEAAQVLDPGGTPKIAYHVLGPVLVHEAATGVGAEALDGALQLLVRDGEPVQLRDVRHDLVLPDLAADRDHLGHAGHGEQPGPQREVGDLAQVHRRGAPVAGQADLDDFAHDGADRPHLRLDPRRHPAAHELQPLVHLLAGQVDVGGPAELDPDHAEAGAGGGPQALGAGHSVQRGFQRVDHELLDLLRRQPGRFDEQRHRGSVQVGEHVDRQPGQLVAAVADQHSRQDEHEQPVA